MKNIFIEYIDNKDLFPCYSPLFKEFLEEIKQIHYIYEKYNIETNKKCWYFIKTIRFNEALFEWQDRRNKGDLFFPNKFLKRVKGEIMLYKFIYCTDREIKDKLLDKKLELILEKNINGVQTWIFENNNKIEFSDKELNNMEFSNKFYI